MPSLKRMADTVAMEVIFIYFIYFPESNGGDNLHGEQYNPK